MGFFSKDDKTNQEYNHEEHMAKLKAFASLTPEELAKKLEEAQKAAQEAFDKLTPEEQQRVKAEAERRIKESEQERKALMESAQKISGAISPKFCPYCGTPNSGGNFCPSCGAALKSV